MYFLSGMPIKNTESRSVKRMHHALKLKFANAMEIVYRENAFLFLLGMGV